MFKKWESFGGEKKGFFFGKKGKHNPNTPYLWIERAREERKTKILAIYASEKISRETSFRKNKK